MDYHNRLERTFNPPATNGNGKGHRLTPEPDQVIGAFEHRQARRHRTATALHVLAILVLGGGLWLVARAVDSGLADIAKWTKSAAQTLANRGAQNANDGQGEVGGK